MRIAVADIGSNSTRLLIADVDGGRVAKELERRSVVTRLGAGVDADEKLRDDSMKRVYDTLEDFTDLTTKNHVDKKIAVLTSAVRDAANGEEFAQTVENRFGFEPNVLTGDREAELTFLGATSERDENDTTPTVVVDIGGGSTEVVVGSGRSAKFHVSTQAGVVRQTERHIHHDPPEERELEQLAEDAENIIAAGVPPETRRAVERRDRGRGHSDLARGDRPAARPV